MAPCSNGRVLLLVPARGGSRGIRGKNLQQVDGASLVARAVICAHRFLKEVPLADARIVVDTDSDAIAHEARAWNAEVPFLRPPALAGDTTTTAESTLHLLSTLASDGWAADTLVLLQPTSPLRSWEDVQSCWQRMTESDAESVVSVVELSKPPQLAMQLGEGNVLTWLRTAAPPPANSRRQDLDAAVSPSGAVYITQAAALRDRGTFVVPGVTVGVPCGASTSQDVDTPGDLLAARRAAVLALSPSPTLVVRLGAHPAEGETVELPGVPGRFLVVAAGGLPALISEWREGRQRDLSGVLVIHEPGFPGPAVWREALGVHVSLWCGTGAGAAELAPVLGAADAMVVPESSPEVGELVSGLLRAMHPLCG